METEVERLLVMRQSAMARHEAAKAEAWVAEEAMRHLLDHLNECVQDVSSTGMDFETVERRLREQA